MCGGGGTQVSTSTTKPWDEQIPYLTAGFEQAKNIYDKAPPNYYPGETLAGFDPAQTAAHQATLGYVMGPRVARMRAGGADALMRSLGGYTGFNRGQTSDLLAGNVRTGAGTPYGAMENALTQGVMNNLQQNILPGIRQQQVQYQPGGSSRAALEQNKAVSRAVQSGLTKPLADMYSGAYQTAQGQRLPAANQIIGQQQYGQSQYPTTMTAPLQMYNAMGKVGADRRAMTQATIDRDMGRYEYDANAPQNALRNYMAMVTGDYGSTTEQTTPGESGLSQLGQIAGIASTLWGMSDIRLKDNIIHIGTDKGYNIYSWDWNREALELGVDTPTYGVMAQEVLETNPDAVALMDNGYYAVNYGEL
jgi:hypothetical protein